MEPDYQLPEVGEAEYLIGMLAEIGEAKFSAGHISAIDWEDIKNWSDMTGAQVTPGEALALRELSGIYVSQHYAALDSSCPMPHIEERPNKEVIAAKMKSLFSMLRN